MKIFSIGLIISMALVCCDKKIDISNPEPEKQLDDARSVLLMDINSHPLPTPYFHFEYDSLHYVKRISFASDLFIYEVEYVNKRVIKMTNLRLGNTLHYSYRNGQVNEINEFSASSRQKTFNYLFTYANGTNLLPHVFWTSFRDNPKDAEERSNRAAARLLRFARR